MLTLAIDSHPVRKVREPTARKPSTKKKAPTPSEAPSDNNLALAVVDVNGETSPENNAQVATKVWAYRKLLFIVVSVLI